MLPTPLSLLLGINLFLGIILSITAVSLMAGAVLGIIKLIGMVTKIISGIQEVK